MDERKELAARSEDLIPALEPGQKGDIKVQRKGYFLKELGGTPSRACEEFFQRDIVLSTDQGTFRAHATRSTSPGVIDLFVRPLKINEKDCLKADELDSRYPFPWKSTLADLFTSFSSPMNVLEEPGPATGVEKVPIWFFPKACLENIRAEGPGLLQKGIIVVCGETGCGKSTFVRELIYRILCTKHDPNQLEQQHFVSFEDPIELPFYVKKSPDKRLTAYTTPFSLAQSYVNVTQRERGHECRCLKDFFKSCLRQKPAVTFVGEIRDVDEWKEAIAYASTGHLLVTTTHAGSVRECFHKLFIASGASTDPSKRSFLSSVLSSIIHLEPVSPRHTFAKAIPSQYVFGGVGTQRVIADSLDAVLPGFDTPSFGYSYFIKLVQDNPSFDPIKIGVQEAQPDFIQKDLRG